MSEHTTFKIGGNADYMILPADERELLLALDYIRKKNINYYIIGNGSNLLVSDEGFRGVIIKIKDYEEEINPEFDENGANCYVPAGVRLSKLAKILANNSLTGFEFASGIPGTLGGAIIMNAGAYGGEIKDCTVSVKVVDNFGNVKILTNEEAEFGYRTSRIMKNGDIVLGANLKFQKGNQEEIFNKMEELLRKRKEKQPLEFPSAGSAFKRPEGNFAGKLIMDAGLRGYRVGDAMISEKHCGFVVNAGNATAKDVLTLLDNVENIVYEKYKVKLEPEIRFLS